MSGRRHAYAARYVEIDAALTRYETAVGPLVGISDPAARDIFIEQVLDSEQRVEYFANLQRRTLSWSSADPLNHDFDPLKAAILQRDAGNYDEAVWLNYLFVHFGRHRTGGWRYARDIYGRLGQGGLWDWPTTSADPISFRFWLADNRDELERSGPHGFGNHRKYESLNAWEPTGTGEAFESYIDWVLDGFTDHAERFADAFSAGPEDGFDRLFRSMSAVRRFGRIAKFDYLTGLQKLKLLDIRPPHTYLTGATGPLLGARLLLEGPGSTLGPREAQQELSEVTRLTGLQPNILEDAVCNWQKRPTVYERFSG